MYDQVQEHRTNPVHHYGSDAFATFERRLEVWQYSRSKLLHVRNVLGEILKLRRHRWWKLHRVFKGSDIKSIQNSISHILSTTQYNTLVNNPALVRELYTQQRFINDSVTVLARQVQAHRPDKSVISEQIEQISNTLSTFRNNVIPPVFELDPHIDGNHFR